MNMAPSQPTFPQVLNFLEFLNKQKLTTQQFQNVMENGDLLKQMLNCPDLSLVDRSAFSALLVPKLTIPWTPVKLFSKLIFARSKKRGWGYTKAETDKLAAELLDHAGDLQPTSVSVWLGKDLKFNYSEILLWIRDEVEKLGFRFKEYSDYANRLSFLSGSEISGKRFLGPCYLELKKFRDKVNGIVFGDVKSQSQRWPSLEVLILLALNPQVYILMDGEKVPYMIAPGLVGGSGRLLGFDCVSGEAYVNDFWDGGRWYSTVFVSFREC